MLYNHEGKAAGSFCGSSPSTGGPEMEGGLERVMVFRSLRREASGESCNRDFLNSEIHGFLLEQDSSRLGSTASSHTALKAKVWLCREHRSLLPSCGSRIRLRSLPRRFRSSPQSCVPRPLVEIWYVTRSDLWLSNCIFPQPFP